MISANEAKELTLKYIEEKITRDEFCEYISGVIEAACKRGDSECVVSIKDLEEANVVFYEDIIIEAGFVINADWTSFCGRPASDYIISWR